MPDVWLPGVTRDPGANAGYNSGRSQMQLAVAHYTVGADSRGIAQRGYFHFLVHQDASREGGCTQYAEVDAITWHAGNWNPFGPGIEFERMVTGPPGPDGLSEAEPLTANQLAWGDKIVDFLTEWGIPAILYGGPRYGAGAWHGWVNHHDLDADRSDGLTKAEWSMITSQPSPDLPPYLPKGVTEDMISTCVGTDGTVYCFVVSTNDHVWVTEKPPGGDWTGSFKDLNGTVRK